MQRPTVGVGGVVVRDGGVVLIRRGKPPLEGRWSLPGGTQELGETLEQALRREVREETGLEVEPVALLTAFDRIDRADGTVRFHYVIVDYLCRVVGGELRAGSDARDAVVAAPEALASYDLTAKALEVIHAGLSRARRLDRARGRSPSA